MSNLFFKTEKSIPKSQSHTNYQKKKKKCNYRSVTMMLDFHSQLLQSETVKTWFHVSPSQTPTFKIRQAQLSTEKSQVIRGH